MIQAIETKYAGHRFRSRLEARWAVFFDAWPTPWAYEHEGFVIDGTPYLPDFWLPEWDCWFEVKGTEPNHDEKMLAYRLSVETGKEVHIAFGSPALRELDETGSFLPARGSGVLTCSGESWMDGPTKSESIRCFHWPYYFSDDDNSLRSFLFRNGYTPHDQIPPDDKTVENRKRLVELDMEYFRATYGKEHWCHTYGRFASIPELFCRRDDGSPWLTQVQSESHVALSAYNAALSARFEHDERVGANGW